MIKVEIDRMAGEFGFEAKDANGHSLKMDTSPENGGVSFGFRPMQVLLAGLGGCSGIDIISILKKQRQKVEGLSIKIEGEREPGKEPSVWARAHVVFELKGEIDPEKARKACELSMDKYCSVAETMRRAGADITWEARVV